MSQTVDRRDVAQVIRSLENRVKNLERRIRDAEAVATASEPEIIFNLNTLVTGVSPPYQVRVASTLYEVTLGLALAGSTDTVVTIYQNGVSIGTATIAAGSVNQSTGFATSFAIDDDLTVAVTTIGTDAEGLVVQCRMR